MAVDSSIVAALRQQFLSAPDVKAAYLEPESIHIYQHYSADLVVETWLGTRLYVYCVAKAPKVRDVRHALKENSRSGIGSLFLVAAELLPQAAPSVSVEDWHEALWALNDQWIYGYGPLANGVGLFQVHFKPTPIQAHYDVWHFSDFHIEAVTVRRRDVQAGIKGTWHVGDIASPTYKRRINQERQNAHFHYSTKYQQAPRATNPHQRDQLALYLELLGVDRNASEKDIKTAFRKLAMQFHPDISPLPRPDAERKMQALLEAYEFIKEVYGWS